MNALVILLCVTVIVQSIPDVIPRFRPGPPVWVSATSALNRDGEFREELFPEYAVKSLNDMRRQNVDKCNVSFGAPTLEDFTPKDSLDGLVGYSLTIVKGRVTAARAGVDNGTPGTLFAVHVDETYKSLGHSATDGPRY